VAAAVRDVIESADTDVTEKGSQHG
jgi:hypothetical protein